MWDIFAAEGVEGKNNASLFISAIVGCYAKIKPESSKLIFFFAHMRKKLFLSDVTRMLVHAGRWGVKKGFTLFSSYISHASKHTCFDICTYVCYY